ncbi:MAG: protein phosphatase 2C domain-containing protein [Marinobacter sp.]|uniref:PP2C family serine/threonine-protein phosphatase n=1 Tax=Marinobacter sp. TaxID=50741 RepID=UPI0034A00378
MTITATGLSDLGTKRDSNQDSLTWRVSADGQRALGVVADGMGGYEGGEIASRITVEALVETLQELLENSALEADSLRAHIQQGIDLASRRIDDARKGQEKLSKMGTTVVLAWLQEDTAWIAHLGDSRAYLFRHGELSQQTRDDTVAQNMVDDGSIKPEEVPRVPFRNVLTRALGSSTDSAATITSVKLVPGDHLILCSDGLTDALSDNQWPAIIGQEKDLESQARALIDASLRNQAADNVSLILLQFDQPRSM